MAGMGRVPYTAEDHQALAEYLVKVPREDWQKPATHRAFALDHPRHTWQSWHSHFRDNGAAVLTRIKVLQDQAAERKAAKKKKKKAALSAPAAAPAPAPAPAAPPPAPEHTVEELKHLADALVKGRNRGITAEQVFAELPEDRSAPKEYTSAQWKSIYTKFRPTIDKRVAASVASTDGARRSATESVPPSSQTNGPVPQPVASNGKRKRKDSTPEPSTEEESEQSQDAPAAVAAKAAPKITIQRPSSASLLPSSQPPAAMPSPKQVPPPKRARQESQPVAAPLPLSNGDQRVSSGKGKKKAASPEWTTDDERAMIAMLARTSFDGRGRSEAFEALAVQDKKRRPAEQFERYFDANRKLLLKKQSSWIDKMVEEGMQSDPESLAGTEIESQAAEDADMTLPSPHLKTQQYESSFIERLPSSSPPPTQLEEQQPAQQSMSVDPDEQAFDHSNTPLDAAERQSRQSHFSPERLATERLSHSSPARPRSSKSRSESTSVALSAAEQASQQKLIVDSRSPSQKRRTPSPTAGVTLEDYMEWTDLDMAAAATMPFFHEFEASPSGRARREGSIFSTSSLIEDERVMFVSRRSEKDAVAFVEKELFEVLEMEEAERAAIKAAEARAQQEAQAEAQALVEEQERQRSKEAQRREEVKRKQALERQQREQQERERGEAEERARLEHAGRVRLEALERLQQQRDEHVALQHREAPGRVQEQQNLDERPSQQADSQGRRANSAKSSYLASAAEAERVRKLKRGHSAGQRAAEELVTDGRRKLPAFGSPDGQLNNRRHTDSFQSTSHAQQRQLPPVAPSSDPPAKRQLANVFNAASSRPPSHASKTTALDQPFEYPARAGPSTSRKLEMSDGDAELNSMERDVEHTIRNVGEGHRRRLSSRPTHSLRSSIGEQLASPLSSLPPHPSSGGQRSSPNRVSFSNASTSPPAAPVKKQPVTPQLSFVQLEQPVEQAHVAPQKPPVVPKAGPSKQKGKQKAAANPLVDILKGYASTFKLKMGQVSSLYYYCSAPSIKNMHILEDALKHFTSRPADIDPAEQSRLNANLQLNVWSHNEDMVLLHGKSKEVAALQKARGVQAVAKRLAYLEKAGTENPEPKWPYKKAR